MQKTSEIISTNNKSFETACGNIDYCLTNDYMFRAILQQNKSVLKALVCSLLHLQPGDITTLEIMNPIELGKQIDSKDFILDIKICLNNNTLINLEMQVENQHNWEERSLYYLCRTFDNLNRGEEYLETKPAIHIGFLNFTPFENNLEFYSTYKLQNIKNGHIYSDKFILSVVNLTQIDLATDEDKLYQIDYWAQLFKARKWEDLRMIAEKSNALKEASESLYTLNADQMVREQCQARQDFYRMQRATEYKMQQLTSENVQLSSEKAQLASENVQLSSENENLTTMIQKQEALIRALQEQLSNT